MGSYFELASDYVWDFWFHVSNGELYLFFLRADKEACQHDPEQRHALATVGLSRWDGRKFSLVCKEPIFSSRGSEYWDSYGIWTGSVLSSSKNPDVAYMMYTSRSERDLPVLTPKELQKPQKIGLLKSKDLIHWERLSQEHPLIPTPGSDYGLDGVNWRDPYLCELIPGEYQSFLTSRQIQPLEWGMTRGGGSVSLLTSNSLEQWSRERLSLFYRTDDFYQMEVPQVFWKISEGGRKKRLYLIFCAQSADASDLRKSQWPNECVTGSYYTFSEEVDLDCKNLPPLSKTIRLLSANLYAGKIITMPGEVKDSFFGFVSEDGNGQFQGGVTGPIPVLYNANGEISVGVGEE